MSVNGDVDVILSHAIDGKLIPESDIKALCEAVSLIYFWPPSTTALAHLSEQFFWVFTNGLYCCDFNFSVYEAKSKSLRIHRISHSLPPNIIITLRQSRRVRFWCRRAMLVWCVPPWRCVATCTDSFTISRCDEMMPCESRFSCDASNETCGRKTKFSHQNFPKSIAFITSWWCSPQIKSKAKKNVSVSEWRL